MIRFTTKKGRSVVAEEHDLATDMAGLLKDVSDRIDRMWLYARLMAVAAFIAGLCAGLLLAKYLT
jgi:hypothetical protein